MSPSRIRVPDLREKKSRGEKIAMLTAYDATMARLLDQAGVDALLVGDSVGMVVLGYENTLRHARRHAPSHARRRPRRFVRWSSPTCRSCRIRSARRRPFATPDGCCRRGASAVKLEGGRPVLEAVRRMVDVGIPVMGHLGLQPQSVHQLGGYIKQATRGGC